MTTRALDVGDLRGPNHKRETQAKTAVETCWSRKHDAARSTKRQDCQFLQVFLATILHAAHKLACTRCWSPDRAELIGLHARLTPIPTHEVCSPCWKMLGSWD